MQIITLPLITGDGSTHNILSTLPASARWVQIIAESVASKTNPIRVGGGGITATQGIPLYQQGASQFFPQNTCDKFDLYNLLDMQYWAESGDTLSVSYGI